MPRLASLRPTRNRVASLPLPAYFGVVTLLYGVLTWAFDALGDHRHATWADLVLHVVVGSLFGAVMTAVIAFQRRRFGGSVLQQATASAVRTGIVPEDADRATWTPVLERRLRTLQRSRWLSPLVVAPVLVLAVVAGALSRAAVVPALWLVVVCLALIVIAEVQAARAVPRARSVLAGLQTPGRRPAAPVQPTRAADGNRPRTVVAALLACAVGVVAVGIEFALFLAQPGSVASAARHVSADGHVSLARAEQLAAVAVAILVTYWSVLLLAFAVLGWFAYTGRNWARASLVPTALLALIELVAHKPVSLAIAIAAVGAVVLLYLPQSGAWFATARRPRRVR